jgi:hypothetical protein
MYICISTNAVYRQQNTKDMSNPKRFINQRNSHYNSLPFFKGKKNFYCTICNKELKHKYKASSEWNIDGYLCADCHIEKTKEFTLKLKDEQKRIAEKPDLCIGCGKEIVLEIDKNKPKSQWNLKSNGSKLCKKCYDIKEQEYYKKLNFCALCNKKIGLIRYNPKPQWDVKGQLCRECWDKYNQIKK